MHKAWSQKSDMWRKIGDTWKNKPNPWKTAAPFRQVSPYCRNGFGGL